MKILKIGTAYLGFMAIFLSLYWAGALPYFALDYLPPLARARTDAMPLNGTYLIGDCTVSRAPYAYPRFARPGFFIGQFTQAINEIPCDLPENVTTDIIILCGGVEMVFTSDTPETRQSIRNSMQQLQSALQARFPNAHIKYIDPYLIDSIASLHPNHKRPRWYLGGRGYRHLATFI